MKKLPKGFTLLETVLSLGLMAIISVLVLSFQSKIFSFSPLLQTSLDSQNDARKAFRTMTKEIRTATYSNTGAYIIAQANTSTLTIYSDVDSDNIRERIRYYLENKTLKRALMEPKASSTPITYDNPETVMALVKNVTNTSTPIFSYYTTNYDGTTSSLALTYPLNTSNIRLIKINLEIVVSDNKGNKIPSSIGTQVSIRNLKDNL